MGDRLDLAEGARPAGPIGIRPRFRARIGQRDPGSPGKVQRIGIRAAFAPGKGVDALAGGGDKDIAVIAADQRIVACPAVEQVGPGFPQQGIIAVAAIKRVGVAAAPDHVITGPGIDGIAARLAIDPVSAGPAVDQIIAVPGIDHVVAKAGVDRIVPRTGADVIVIAACPRQTRVVVVDLVGATGTRFDIARVDHIAARGPVDIAIVKARRIAARLQPGGVRGDDAAQRDRLDRLGLIDGGVGVGGVFRGEIEVAGGVLHDDGADRAGGAVGVGDGAIIAGGGVKGVGGGPRPGVGRKRVIGDGIVLIQHLGGAADVLGGDRGHMAIQRVAHRAIGLPDQRPGVFGIGVALGRVDQWSGAEVNPGKSG